MNSRRFSLPGFRKRSKNATPRWEILFRGLVKVGSFLNVLPMKYNRSTGLYTAINRSPLKLFLWNFLLILAFTDCVCLQISAKGIYLKNVGAQEYIDFYLHYFSRLTGFILVWGIARRHKECVEGLNLMFSNSRIWKTTQNEFGEDFGGPIQNSIKRTIKYTTIYVLLQPFVGLSVHLENRSSRRYWISQLILGSAYDTSLGIICSGLIDFYLSLMMTIPSATTVIIVAAHGSILYFWATTLATRFRSRPEKWKHGYYTYTSIQAFIKILEPTFCMHLAPIVVYICFWDLVLCICALVTCFRTFPLPVFIDFFICILLLFLLLNHIINVGGNVLVKGEEFKEIANHFLNNSYPGKLASKQLASCGTLKKHTFMLYMRLVFDRSIDAILTVVQLT